MYQFFVTIAALTSVMSPSMNYYSYIKPQNESHFFADDLQYCPKTYKFVTYQMMHLGEDMYKLVPKVKDVAPLKFSFLDSTGEHTMEPAVYLNTDLHTSERPIFPKSFEISGKSSRTAGVSEESILEDKYHCHDETKMGNKFFKYGLDFGTGVKLELTPENYSHQIDITTDLCTNLLNFKTNLDELSARPVVVLNTFILEKMCYVIDYKTMEISIGQKSLKGENSEILVEQVSQEKVEDNTNALNKGQETEQIADQDKSIEEKLDTKEKEETDSSVEKKEETEKQPENLEAETLKDVIKNEVKKELEKIAQENSQAKDETKEDKKRGFLKADTTVPAQQKSA